MAELRNHGGETGTLPSWAALGIVLVAVGVAYVAAVVAILVAFAFSAMLHGASPDPTPAQLDRFIEELRGSAFGSAVLILPNQTVFFAVAALGGLLYRGQVRRRYRLQAPRGRLWQWILAVIATLGPAMLLGCVVEALRDEPLEMELVFRSWFQRQEGWNLVGLLMLIAGAPALCEELLFRGFLLSHLERRWPAWLAVAATAAAFAAAHLDPWHVLLVIPLGLWTSLVTRAFDSLYPAIAAHLYNNVVAVLLVVSGHDSGTLADPVTATLLAVSLLAFGLSVPVIRVGLRDGRAQRAEASPEEVFLAVAVGHEPPPEDRREEGNGTGDSPTCDPT